MAPNAATVNHHLDQALSSPLFRKAERQSRFLRFVVEVALQSPDATIKEFDIAVAVYDRRPDYDPRTDPIVRVEAARLRARLREYYELQPPESVRIDLPKGGYLPRFISLEEASAQMMGNDLSILVAPFRSLSADPRDQSFCDGLTEEVVDKLAGDRRLRVITQSAVTWMEHRGHKPRFLLEASVRRAGEEIRLALHLVEVTGDGSMRLSKIYQFTISDVFANQERLAQEIRGDIVAALDISETDSGRIN